MKTQRLSKRLVSLLVATVFLASPLLLVAQHRRAGTPRRSAPVTPVEPPQTFDNLLATDTYKVYCEVRGVGGLMRSSAVTDLLNPFMKVSGGSKEFSTMISWLDAHADALAGSRLMIAGWASRPNLPSVLMAIEFSSAEDAKKFYPELRDFLPTLLPTPTPTPSPTTTPDGSPAAVLPVTPPDASNGAPVAAVSVAPPQIIAAVAEPQPAPTPPYQMKQVGTLVLLSNVAFKMGDLKPRNSKPLEEDQNFVLARNRFASESIFLYIDTKAIDKEEQDRRAKYEEEMSRAQRERAKYDEEMERIQREAASATPEPSPEIAEPATTPPPAEELPSPSPDSDPDVVQQPPTAVANEVAAQPEVNVTLSTSPPPDNDEPPIPYNYNLEQAFFGGDGKWPDALALAVVFEGDAYVVRTLIINDNDSKPNPIPFVPQFASGPAIVPDAASIFPADTDLFVSVSLDYPQIYEGMVKALARAEEQARKSNRGAARQLPPLESPFAVYEKKLGLKIKDDLLPLLGNELALALPKRPPTATPSPAGTEAEKTTAPDSGPKPPKSPDPIPVVAISIKDREAVARLIPKIIDALGVKGASLFGQTERRDGVEITSYGNIFAYAFVGDFLVVSPDAAATRQVVDAYLNHQTLSSDSHYRNFTRWQPRQVLAQIYIAPGLVQQYNPIFGSGGRGDEKTSELLSRLNPVIDPLTYALTNDGQGPLHELHVPKNLLMWMIADVTRGESQDTGQMYETTAQSLLRTVAAAESMFQENVGKGQYGTLDELEANKLISKDYLQNYGYIVELTVSGTRFEATAVPKEYGKTGKLSYFIDETGVMRGGDHGGGAATVADPPMD
jgi:hypothetical protein